MAVSLMSRSPSRLLPATFFSASARYVHRQTEFMPWKKKEFWHGREEEHQRVFHRKGMLPRLRDENVTKGEMHNLIQPRKDPWHPTEALFGQNDYIDILGDGTIHPVRLLTNVPKWLRGFRGHEIKMLVRKKQSHPEWKETRPQEWLNIKKRTDYLYAYLNLRKRPPPIEKY